MSGQSQLTLTELAAERLAVATRPVGTETGRGSSAKTAYDVVPYSSLIYDPEGKPGYMSARNRWYTFVNPSRSPSSKVMLQRW